MHLAAGDRKRPFWANSSEHQEQIKRPKNANEIPGGKIVPVVNRM